MPELSRYVSPFKFSRICLRPSFSNCAMLLFSAPLSKEVNLPVTSTTETCPTCRMVAEKLTGMASSWGHPNSTCGGEADQKNCELQLGERVVRALDHDVTGA